jgi:hypothetical protein
MAWRPRFGSGEDAPRQFDLCTGVDVAAPVVLRGDHFRHEGLRARRTFLVVQRGEIGRQVEHAGLDLLGLGLCGN